MLAEWTKKGLAALPVEAKIVRKVIRAFKDAGNPIVKVWDSEAFIKVEGEHAILNEVFGVDMARLYTADGSWVLIILGNEWDVISDYTLDVEEILDPVNKWVAENER